MYWLSGRASVNRRAVVHTQTVPQRLQLNYHGDHFWRITIVMDAALIDILPNRLVCLVCLLWYLRLWLTANVISGWVLTCNSALYSNALLGEQGCVQGASQVLTPEMAPRCLFCQFAFNVSTGVDSETSHLSSRRSKRLQNSYGCQPIRSILSITNGCMLWRLTFSRHPTAKCRSE